MVRSMRCLKRIVIRKASAKLAPDHPANTAFGGIRRCLSPTCFVVLMYLVIGHFLVLIYVAIGNDVGLVYVVIVYSGSPRGQQLQLGRRVASTITVGADAEARFGDVRS